MNAPVKSPTAIPFDTARLDRLMDEAGMDVLIVNSKHNVQYLLGGHRAFFFDYMDAMGVSRYLPIVVYAKGAPDKAAYFGHRLENFQRENNPFWTPVQQCNSSGSTDTMAKAIEHIRSAGIKTRGIGAELSFLPVDAGKALSDAFSGSGMKDALFVLERMRAIKTPDELAKLKIASEAVIDSMKAVIAKHGPGSTTAQVTEALRREETNR
jgi:Xaa-Pro aminopeptidase